MTWLPGTVHKSLGKQTQPQLTKHDIICVHTMVGYLSSTFAMFHEEGYTGTESHVGIGGKWGPDEHLGLDGVSWQFQDTNYTADANYEGSWHILSIETADNNPKLPEQILPWTPKQVAELVRIIVLWCKEYDIPPVLIPDTKPGRRGLAYHYQGVGLNLVKGGEVWSKAGHVCPGPVRVQQYIHEVIPKVQAALKLHVAEEDDMKWTDPIALTATDAKYWNLTSDGINPKTKKAWKEGDLVTFSDMVRYPTQARKTDLKVDEILKKLGA